MCVVLAALAGTREPLSLGAGGNTGRSPENIL